MNIPDIIEKFDRYLNEHHQNFSAIIVGGAALSLLRVTSRVTNDIDVLNPNVLPEKVGLLTKEFALQNNLPESWINCGPSDVSTFLPEGWMARTRKIFSGKNLELITLGHGDLILTKCWAYCDRQRDLEDIVAMSPTINELKAAREWLKPLDSHPGWPDYVDKAMSILEKSCEKTLRLEP
jgi:hypothetical protein